MESVSKKRYQTGMHRELEDLSLMTTMSNISKDCTILSSKEVKHDFHIHFHPKTMAFVES